MSSWNVNANESGLAAAARLATEDERQAAQTLRSMEQRIADEVMRLEVLERYALEYEQRVPRVVEQQGGLQVLRNARGFVAQLTASSHGQRDVVQRLRQDAEAARARWISARVRREALDKLVTRRADETRRAQDKVEQQRIDDRAAATIARRGPEV